MRSGIADVLGHGHVRIERVALEHHRDVAVARLDARHVAVADVHGAGGRDLEAGEHAQRGRLAAARRPEQHEERAVGHVEVERAQRERLRVEALLDAAEADLAHACLGGPVDSRTISSPRTSSRCSTWRPSLTAASTQLGGARAHGRGVLAHRRQPDAVVRRQRHVVEAGHGDVLGHAQAAALERVHEVDRHAVVHAADGRRVRVERDLVQAAPPHGRRERLRPAVDLGLARVLACEREALVSEIGEVADHGVHGLFLVDVDRARAAVERAAERGEHRRHAAVEQVGQARRVLRQGGEDDAVDAARDECAALRRLDLGIAVGVGDQHGVAVAARAPHDRLRERRGERIDRVGDDEAERAGRALLECARNLVGPVAELRDRGLDAPARDRRDGRRAAHDVRDRRLRDAGAARDVVERHCHASASRSATAEASIEASGESVGSSCSIETTPS